MPSTTPDFGFLPVPVMLTLSLPAADGGRAGDVTQTFPAGEAVAVLLAGHSYLKAHGARVISF
jgi:hypothetical protein